LQGQQRRQAWLLPVPPLAYELPVPRRPVLLRQRPEQQKRPWLALGRPPLPLRASRPA